jgi:hypothetical protein
MNYRKLIDISLLLAIIGFAFWLGQLSVKVDAVLEQAKKMQELQYQMMLYVSGKPTRGDE